MHPSRILAIAADVRQRQRAGRPIANFTVGDFDTRAFPLAPAFRAAIDAAFAAGATSYPPLAGHEALREAIVAHEEAAHGVRLPLESVLVASGARPFLYGTFQCVLDPGDVVVYAAPSWSNEEFAALAGARSVLVQSKAENAFQPTLDDLRPYLGEARLVCLNTPLNPSGTAMREDNVRAIFEAVVRENEERQARGARPLFVIFDQVYGELMFGGARHAHPLKVVPAARPWTVIVDAISKSLAATGLRVGWGFVPPVLFSALRDVVCHSGAWAPTPIQVALASFLPSKEAAEYRATIRAELARRITALLGHVERMRAAGYAIESITPDGGIYVTLRLPIVGRSFRGQRIESDEAARVLLLEHADVALVPFDAFCAADSSGWYRASVGAVDVPTIDRACASIEAVLRELA